MLVGHPTLRSLNLSRTNLTDTTAPALESLLGCSTCLQELDLSWNKLSIGSGRALGAGLFKTKSLTHLHLGWNSLQDAGTAAIAEALRFNGDCPLIVLNLSAARMQSQVISAAAAPFPRAFCYWRHDSVPRLQGYLKLASMVKHNPSLRLRRLVLNFSLMDNVGAQCLMRTMKGKAKQRLKLEMDNCTL